MSVGATSAGAAGALALLLLGEARAAQPVAWTSPSVSPEQTSLAGEALDGFVLRPGDALPQTLGVVPLGHGAPACDGLVSLSDWRLAAEEARLKVLGLDLADALARFASLDVDTACLDAVPSDRDLFGFYLSAAEAHLLTAQVSPVPEFHEGEGRSLVRRAAVMGRGLSAPIDTAPEARAALDAARRDLKGRAPGRVKVVGNADAIWWDGRRVGDGVLRVSPGSHLAQITSDGRVSDVRVVQVEPDGAVLLWSDPAPPPDAALLASAIRTLEETGRAHAVLTPVLEVLGDAVIVTRTGDVLKIWEATGGLVRLRAQETVALLEDEEVARETSSVGAQIGVLLGVGWPDVDAITGPSVALWLSPSQTTALGLHGEITAPLDAAARQTDGVDWMARAAARWVPGVGMLGVEAGLRRHAGSAFWPVALGLAGLRVSGNERGGLWLEGSGGWGGAAVYSGLSVAWVRR